MTAALATQPATQSAAAKQDHARDFDFLHGGTWNIHNKRLKLRLQGCTEWEAFSATASARPIIVHYIWSRVNTASPRWEQAFSGDGGKTWETNWIMDFTRVE